MIHWMDYVCMLMTYKVKMVKFDHWYDRIQCNIPKVKELMNLLWAECKAYK